MSSSGSEVKRMHSFLEGLVTYPGLPGKLSAVLEEKPSGRIVLTEIFTTLRLRPENVRRVISTVDEFIFVDAFNYGYIHELKKSTRAENKKFAITEIGLKKLKELKDLERITAIKDAISFFRIISINQATKDKWVVYDNLRKLLVVVKKYNITAEELNIDKNSFFTFVTRTSNAVNSYMSDLRLYRSLPKESRLEKLKMIN